MSRISFKRFNKRFIHTVQFRTTREGGAHCQSHTLSKCLRVFYYIGRTVITQLFYFIGYSFNKIKTEFYSFGNQILHYTPVNTPGSYHVIQNLTITTVQTECNLNPVSIETENLKDIRTPTYVTLVGLNNSIMDFLTRTVVLLLLLQLIFIAGSARRKWSRST